jgi:hypothetical protein
MSSSKAERDARADALEKATTAWAKKEYKRLTAEVSFLKKVKQSSAAGKVGSANAAASKSLLVSNIGQFLSG